MNNIKKFLEKYFPVSIELKEKFKITENKKWTPITVLSELNVQLGHLSLLLSENKEYGEKKRKIDNIGDEISDVILQLITLCNKLKIDILSYDYEYKKIKFKSDKDAILAFNIVYGQVSEMIMEINGFRHYKIRYGYSTQNKFLLNKIANLFSIIFSIIENQNIDINTEYKKMIKNANVFLKRYSKNTDYFPIVDVHATWLVLNPIQGCPKKCRYCFLRERDLNQVKPNILLSPEEATKKLIKSKFYNKD